MRVMNRCVRACNYVAVQPIAAAPLASTSAQVLYLLWPQRHFPTLCHGHEVERHSDLHEMPVEEFLNHGRIHEAHQGKYHSPCGTSDARDTTIDIHPQRSPCKGQCRTHWFHD
jgi:hypothetical protein